MTRRLHVATAAVIGFALTACKTPTTSAPLVNPAVDVNRRPIPAGAVLRVRLYHSIDSNRTQPGDSFIASLSAPVTVDEKTVVPTGTVVRGSIRQAPSSGQPKSRAALALTLDRMEWNGGELPIRTNGVTWTGTDHKKLNLERISGESTTGALAGALLGGGKGARIGAAAAGGESIPANSVFMFRLEEALAI